MLLALTDMNNNKLKAHRLWLSAMALIHPLAIHAATVIGPEIPSAGTLIQELRPPQQGFTLPAATGLVIEPQMDATGPDEPPFLLTAIQITDNKIFPTPVLHALVADAEGQTVTLKRLSVLVARITDYYHANGYPVARAIVPAQTVVNGVFKIQVIEGKYGEIKIDNKSRLGTPVLEAMLAPLKSEPAINQSSLERAMLLLSDLPGVVPKAVLKPGKAVGTADLDVEIAPSPTLRGTASMDNYGNQYTGRFRAGGNIEFLNPLRLGDLGNLSLLTSGKGMAYGRMSYEAMLNAKGASAGAAVSALRYALGGPLAILGGRGTAIGESVWAKQTLMRSVPTSVYVQLQFDHKTLKDEIDSIALKSERALTNLSVNVYGVLRDGVLAGAQSIVGMNVEFGRVAFKDAGAGAIDSSAANTRGTFVKVNLNLTRLQSLSPTQLVYLSLNTQFANKNLDPSEKMVLGGPNSVRGYDTGVLSADDGLLATVEFRQALGQVLKSQWQAVTFFDAARANINHNPWLSGQTNSVSMNSAGLGLNFASDRALRGRLMLAKRLGAAPDVVGKPASARLWAELSMGF